MSGVLEVGVNILLHLLDTPRGTVELQLVARAELGLEARLRPKTTKLPIVHDTWKVREKEKGKGRRCKKKA